MPDKPLVASAALRRGDGRVLLVRHAREERSGAGSRWTLPSEPVADDETAEQALARLLGNRLHLTPARTEFSDSIALPSAIANVFVCSSWSGDPQYAPADFIDAAWAPPGSAPGIDLVEGVREWLSSLPADGGAVPKSASAEDLTAELIVARDALRAAYLALDEPWRDVSLDGEWAPIDLLTHCATVEAYYASEARELLETPGHTWRPFNPAQGEAERAGRPRPASDREELERLDTLRAETLAWLEGLEQDQLDAYGDHADRGAVRVGDRVARIAAHDRAHTQQLEQMLAASQADPDDDEEADDAPADR
ncbi:MAG: NUDIX domain-containing protein [Chloroflexi bacterium]|nr:NUDIX domain-containing protein [Chloroflexota bacterium]